jgi:hypothetical protein
VSYVPTIAPFRGALPGRTTGGDRFRLEGRHLDWVLRLCHTLTMAVGLAAAMFASRAEWAAATRGCPASGRDGRLNCLVSGGWVDCATVFIACLVLAHLLGRLLFRFLPRAVEALRLGYRPVRWGTAPLASAALASDPLLAPASWRRTGTISHAHRPEFGFFDVRLHDGVPTTCGAARRRPPPTRPPRFMSAAEMTEHLGEITRSTRSVPRGERGSRRA